MAGVDAAVDGGGEHDATALLQVDEAVPPGRIVRGQACAGDRHEPPAIGEARQRRGDMAERRVGDTALDMRRDRERRVHQHDAWPHGEVEMVVDLGRVMPRDRNVRKEPAEQGGAGLGQLVQDETASGELCEDGEKTGASRGLQHEIRRRNRGRGGGGKAERDRRRKLLKRLALFGTARVRGQQCRNLGQHSEQCRGRTRATAHAGSEPAQEQDRRGLACVISGLPVPRAFGIGAAEGVEHGGAKRWRVDGPAVREVIEERRGRGDKGRRRVGRSGHGGRRGREGGRRSEHVHGGNLRRAGTGRAGWALSLDPTGSNPSRPSSASRSSPREKGPGAARRTL